MVTRSEPVAAVKQRRAVDLMTRNQNGSLKSAYRKSYSKSSSRRNIVGNGTIQDKRMISTIKLNALLRLHPWPINVIVSHDPSGKIYLGMSLALRCFQRLSLPHLAAQRCS